MKKNHKKLLIAFILCLLICIYVYICAIDAIPKNTIIFQGEELNIKTIFGISVKVKNKEYDSILTSSTIENEQQDSLGTTNLQVQLFNKFTVKEVSVSVIERTKVIPVGQISGLKLYTSGVLVVGMAEIKGTDNIKYKPYENSGIEEGDMIIEVSNNIITDTQDLLKTVNSSNGNELNIKYVRDGKTLQCNITPVKTSSNEYKLGLWVRDSAAGIGTMTFYEPSTGNFAALGHGISDIDTGELVDISNGEFVTTNVLSIIKGQKGTPGKIQGSIQNALNVGTITKNTSLGIFGIINDKSTLKLNYNSEMDVASREEIELGEANILCSLDGNEVKEYSIQIEKLFINNNYNNKSMLIEVTDKDLLNQTGGIIQGMSGCPIIQNGKFIGAITNVLVNDPTKGYGIFGDLMIKEMKSVN